MTITLTNLRYTNPEQSHIEMTVQLDEGEPFPYDGTPIAFHYVPADGERMSVAVREELANGSYDIAPYEPPPPPAGRARTAPPGTSNVIED
jgi:hypothetical protein